MSASGLLTAASRALSAEHYDAAIPYLEEYLDRMLYVSDSRVQAMLQEVRFKLAKINAWLDAPDSVVDYLQEYVDQLPMYKPREAYKLLALNLYALGEYEDCISATTNALAQPLPRGVIEELTAVDYDTLSEDELGGFTVRQLKRLDEEEDDRRLQEGVSAKFSADRPDPEPDLSVDELVLLNMTMAEACSELDDWERSLAPYQFVVDHTPEEDRRGYAIMKMVTALIELERFEDAAEFVSELYRTNARYDIRVNMALMNAASALFEAKEYVGALKLYRMVLPRKDLLAYQEKEINKVRQEAGLPFVEIRFSTNTAGRVETVFGTRFDRILQQQASVDSSVQLPPKPDELLRLEEAVEALVMLPPYEMDVIYQTAQLYAEVGRPWEAVASFNRVVANDPDSELGQRAFAETLMVLVNPLKEYEQVEQLGAEYLISHNEGLGPRQVALALTVCYQRQERWKAIKELLPTIEGFVFSQEFSVRQYECELYFMQAVAEMMLLDHQAALSGFARILEDYNGLQQQENAMYWHAICKLYLQDYEGARAELEDYNAQYPEGYWAASAAFNIGVCLFGMDEYETSRSQFTHVIQTYPDSEVYSDACSMRGDLWAASDEDNGLELAQADYEEAIESAIHVRQASYAVFQMATMFELNGRYDEILEVVKAYQSRYGDEADVAKSAFWIGKTQQQQGLLDQAVQTYADTVIRYGGDVLQHGVDLVINELATTARYRLDDSMRAALVKTLKRALEEAGSETLQLRLRVLLATINGTELELGRQLIAEVGDLSQAPPPVLAVICDASFDAKDYSRSLEILEIFKARYEDSDFTGSAYKLRCYDLFEQAMYSAALEITDDVQALYGSEKHAVWAQIMKGRIFARQGLFDAARETLLTVLEVAEWRGIPYAEATYYLGVVEETAGDPRQAFAWYQRTYMQYKGYAEGYWAAEGYLASARCLEKLGLSRDQRNTYRAMLFDKFVNKLPQADQAREALGTTEAQEIDQKAAQGVHTNLTVVLEPLAPAAEETQE